MAVTQVTNFLKPRYNEVLDNRVQTDVSIQVDFNKYSTTDVTIGGSDTLEFQVLTIPAGTLADDVWIKVNTANGGALTATILDGFSDASGVITHASTFDMNAATIQRKPLLTTKDTFAVETNIVIAFPNSGVVKPALEFEVGIKNICKASWLD